ncbi:hypothetical protein DPQ22_01530 [Candidatus Tokpelaia sp.]|nr:hypothetical protein DPQ22_01530 [Candidatus Tokpelaia sp.]
MKGKKQAKAAAETAALQSLTELTGPGYSVQAETEKTAPQPVREAKIIPPAAGSSLYKAAANAPSPPVSANKRPHSSRKKLNTHGCRP